jgi:hypothetical protein
VGNLPVSLRLQVKPIGEIAPQAGHLCWFWTAICRRQPRCSSRSFSSLAAVFYFF